LTDENYQILVAHSDGKVSSSRDRFAQELRDKYHRFKKAVGVFLSSNINEQNFEEIESFFSSNPIAGGKQAVVLAYLSVGNTESAKQYLEGWSNVDGDVKYLLSILIDNISVSEELRSNEQSPEYLELLDYLNSEDERLENLAESILISYFSYDPQVPVINRDESQQKQDGASKHKLQSPLTIFPNPNEGEFTIDLSSFELNSGKVIVQTITGQVIDEKTVNQQAIVRFNLTEKGIYLISYSNLEGEIISTSKAIVR